MNISILASFLTKKTKAAVVTGLGFVADYDPCLECVAQQMYEEESKLKWVNLSTTERTPWLARAHSAVLGMRTFLEKA